MSERCKRLSHTKWNRQYRAVLAIVIETNQVHGVIKTERACFIEPFLMAKCVIQMIIAFITQNRRKVSSHGKQKAARNILKKEIYGWKGEDGESRGIFRPWVYAFMDTTET